MNLFTPKCDECGKRKFINPFSLIPAMVGFVLEDGTCLNVCSDCIEAHSEKTFGEIDEHFKELGKKKGETNE